MTFCLVQVPGPQSKTLKAVITKILSADRCEKAYYDYKTNDLKTKHIRFMKKYEICVQPSTQTACTGDSGGPLVCEGTAMLTINRSFVHL